MDHDENNDPLAGCAWLLISVGVSFIMLIALLMAVEEGCM